MVDVVTDRNPDVEKVTRGIEGYLERKIALSEHNGRKINYAQMYMDMITTRNKERRAFKRLIPILIQMLEELEKTAFYE